ncbi:MAG TPA: tRNA (adenosine(37)-N6)-threonylcarbamoyltransferase complex ATPase subunit type 1 TsaE [Candidatus Paceibacterota bacterium]|nr:tRNA (adenosine(37)-N6)-threonylcarbamoyltransferase complex ATPase subunit type 1 TsaE [Candidatus Paceibacterota bacterium]
MNKNLNKYKTICENEKEMENFANYFFEEIIKKIDSEKKEKKQRATIVGLYGDLGSGKTTFTKYFVKHFGISDTITSPTFVIQKKFKIESGYNFEKLYHLDVYRLKSGSELLTLDWQEISTTNKNIILIEWPEIVSEILPDDIIKIKFEFIDENKRSVELEWFDL